MGSTKAIALAGVQSVTRLGLAADVATAVVTNIFTVAGTIILVSIFGRVVVQKEANAQLIQLQHIPTDSGVAADLAAASATTSGDDVDTFYMITGNIGDAMIVAPAALGVSNHMVNAAGLVGAPQGLLLAPGIITMETTVATDNSGLINWTCLFKRIAATGGGTPNPADGITVL